MTNKERDKKLEVLEEQQFQILVDLAYHFYRHVPQNFIGIGDWGRGKFHNEVKKQIKEALKSGDKDGVIMSYYRRDVE